MARKKKYRYHGITIGPERFHRGQIKFYFILLPFVLFMLLPIIYIFAHALKGADELFAYPPKFFVRRPTLDNFRALFRMMSSSNISFTRYLYNNIIVTVAVLVCSIFMSLMAGYCLSKKRFRRRDTLFKINQISLMFVPTAVTIPRFLIVSRLNIMDTYWAHILPTLAMPVGLFLIKQFIDQIPNELVEAAEIDGAGDLTILRKIIYPMVKPAIATIGILSFQQAWNNVETSTYYINDETMRTFSFYIGNLTNVSGNVVAGQGMSAAAALIMFLPNLIIFIFMQSKMLNTMAYSGIK